MPYVKGALIVAKQVFAIVKEGRYGVSDYLEVMSKMTHHYCSGQAVRELIGLYDLYDATLRANNLIEFADQEVLVLEYLHKNPFYLEKYGFEHIIIDEFQDTGAAMLELAKAFEDCPSWKSTMIVGDDSQAIYESLKGAKPEMLVHIEEYWGKPFDYIKLVENHRSTPEILDCANRMNDKRIDKVDKALVATRAKGDDPIAQGFLTKEEEMDYVIDSIKGDLERGHAPEDIFVEAVTKAELLAVRDRLDKEGIPSSMMNPETLMENSRVQAALAICRAVDSRESTKDMLIYANALRPGHDLIHATAPEIEEAIGRVKAEVDRYKGMTSGKRDVLMDLLKALDENEDEIYESFLEKLENRRSARDIVSYCRDFERFGANEAMRRTSLQPGVGLITVHSSKGLERPIVYVLMSKFDGPEFHTVSPTSRKMVEERKRLLFVAMTRARDKLVMTGQYVSHGKRGAYTMNQFLQGAYDCVGKTPYTESDVELLRKEREAAKKAAKKAEKEKASVKAAKA